MNEMNDESNRNKLHWFELQQLNKGENWCLLGVILLAISINLREVFGIEVRLDIPLLAIGHIPEYLFTAFSGIAMFMLLFISMGFAWQGEKLRKRLTGATSTRNIFHASDIVLVIPAILILGGIGVAILFTVQSIPQTLAMIEQMDDGPLFTGSLNHHPSESPANGKTWIKKLPNWPGNNR